MQGDPDQPRLVAGEVLPAEAGGAGASVHDDVPRSSDPSEVLPGFAATDRLRRKASPLLFWSTGLLAAFLVFWISGGHRLILDPLAATIQNAPAQALQIEDVTTRIERRDGVAHLFVEGAARNRGEKPLTLPSIVIAVSEADGPTVRYYLETNQSVLEAGHSYPFSSRLDAPGKGVASVSITFGEGSH